MSKREIVYVRLLTVNHCRLEIVEISGWSGILMSDGLSISFRSRNSTIDGGGGGGADDVLGVVGIVPFRHLRIANAASQPTVVVISSVQ